MSGNSGVGSAGSSPPGRRTGHPDLVISGGGTVYLIHAVSSSGEAWVIANIPSDAPRLGAAVAVEHRFITDIVQGAILGGLKLR